MSTGMDQGHPRAMERHYTVSHDRPYVSPNYEDAVISPPVCTKCGYMLRHQADTLSQECSSRPKVYFLKVNHDRALAGLLDNNACALCSYAQCLIPRVRRRRGISDSIPLHPWQDGSERQFEGWTNESSLHHENNALHGRLRFSCLGPVSGPDAGVHGDIVLHVRNEATSPQTCFWRADITQTPVTRLQSARKWLKNCRENHVQCQDWRVQPTRQRPARLLKIEGAMVKLSTCAQNAQVQYVALSHCWGKLSDAKPLKTEKSNVRQHSDDGIEIGSLPLTFRDAVVTTHELGMEYLWIDSLCIVQDDCDDGQREAANMADIYGSAELTILASWAANSTDGCFSEYIPPLSFELRTPGINFMKARSAPVRLVVRAESMDRKSTPLSLRKWTLQENVLSLRRLEFSETQITWTCATTAINEEDTPMDQGMANLAAYSLTPGGEHSMDQYYSDKAWNALVHDYSQRSMTFASDKLAGFAGICKMFESLSHDKIVVGLRQNQLSSDILWRSQSILGAEHGQLDRSAIAALNLPTWSWLKSDKTIMTESALELDAENLFMVLDTDIRWAGVPTTSRIVHAGLTVLGKILPITAIFRQKEDACMCIADRAELRLPTGVIIPGDMGRWEMDDCVHALPRDISCLLIGYTDPSFLGKAFHALLIMPEDDGTSSHFVRVGVTDIYGLSDDDVAQCPKREIVLV